MITTLKAETEWPSKNEIKVINALKTVSDSVSVLYITTEQFKEVTFSTLLKPFFKIIIICNIFCRFTSNYVTYSVHVLPCHLFVVIRNGGDNKKFRPVRKVLSSQHRKLKRTVTNLRQPHVLF